MTYHSSSLFISGVVVVFSVLLYTCIGKPCPEEVTCTKFGYVVFDKVTSESAVCLANGAKPLCLGTDDKGIYLPTTTSISGTTTSISGTTTSISGTTTSISGTTTSISATTATTVPSCGVASCTTKGVFAYPECKCEKYYICSRAASGSGRLVLRRYTCTGGKVFHIKTLSCVTNTLVCPYTQG
ncbi:hypothetical protein OTU49_003786 [Cherax quadricarinatus]|uniref:Chitin-binding type-2 domain-containing protein n=1 Tax=Cherax quadricarinatus TaxID=27406 RepID=A0AAW0XLV9_CHEQU